MEIVKTISLIFVGILLGVFNSLAIKYTIKQMLKYKNVLIVLLSFFVRMVVIGLVFYVFLDRKWQNALLILAGLTISKIFFILLEKTKVKK